MYVYEYHCRIVFKEDMEYEIFSEKMANFIDRLFEKDSFFLEFHKSKEYKNYVFDMAYKPEDDKIYKKEKIYTVRIRTIMKDLAEYFLKNMPFHQANNFFCVGGEIKIISKKVIEKVYTLTPALIKESYGYWKDNMTLSEYENRIKANLIKKYNNFTGEKLDEDFQLFDIIEFKNSKPVKTKYKNIVLLGDKLNFIASKNETAQKLWYMSLGTGILENNSRGFGFLNYRYL